METDTETDIEAPARPDGLPDEFWDADAGCVRLDELVGAYGALASAGRAPASPEDYALELDGLIGGPDPEANRRDEFYPQSMYFEDQDRGWIAGLGGVVLATDDGGETWETQSTGTLVTLYTLAKSNGQLFVTGGEGSIFRHDGNGWIPVDHGRPFRQYLRGIEPLSDHRLIVSGPAGVLQIFSIGELTGDTT